MKKVGIIIAIVVVVAGLAIASPFIFGGKSRHNEYIISSQDPTCIEDGYEEKACDCGCGYYEWIILPAPGYHDFDQDPGCGVTAVCRVCGEEEIGPDHQGGVANCEEGKICDLCGEMYTQGINLSIMCITMTGLLTFSVQKPPSVKTAMKPTPATVKPTFVYLNTALNKFLPLPAMMRK